MCECYTFARPETFWLLLFLLVFYITDNLNGRMDTIALWTIGILIIYSLHYALCVHKWIVMGGKELCDFHVLRFTCLHWGPRGFPIPPSFFPRSPISWKHFLAGTLPTKATSPTIFPSSKPDHDAIITPQGRISGLRAAEPDVHTLINIADDNSRNKTHAHSPRS